MEVEEKDFSLQPTERSGKRAKEAHSELPEVFLITLAITGSIAGAISGSLISKLYLDSFLPTACGTLGCMIGCMFICTVGYYYWMLFRSSKVPGLNTCAFGSDEKSMEKEVHASGNYC
jgi:hypothetical protein